MLAQSALNGQAVSYEFLAEGVGLHVWTLQQCVQFAREYPKLDLAVAISWSHYCFLLTVSSREERDRWTKRILAENLKTADLKALLVEAQLAYKPMVLGQPVVNRGVLYTYRIIKVSYHADSESGFLCDCGFNIRILPPAGQGIIDNTWVVNCVKSPEGKYSLRISDRTVKEIYTYKAMVSRVIDADTCIVNVDCGFGIYIEQTLRLRGIDAPELSTAKGEQAKRFVEDQLARCSFVIIKTYKTDKYDRYLVDVFYDDTLSQVSDVAGRGKLLNYQLLMRGLAVEWKP